MNVLAKQWELHTHLASLRNWVSVCPVFNCFPAPLEKTREDFWCAWRLESHLSWLAAISHGDGGFQEAYLKLCCGNSFCSQTQGWDVGTEPTGQNTGCWFSAHSAVIVNSGQTVLNFKVSDLLKVFPEHWTLVWVQFWLNHGLVKTKYFFEDQELNAESMNPRKNVWNG